jgi:hypothetical protein
MDTFEDYIKYMIKEGYWAETDLSPLKCHHCESKNLEDKNWSYENMGVVEYERWCNDCCKMVNIWAYGNWCI